MEFQAWPKIPRLNRSMTITEKIDGTNACISVVAAAEVDERITQESEGLGIAPGETATASNVVANLDGFVLFAQSRKRLIVPADVGGKGADNAGFAGWVRDNAEALLPLGPGRHYGEWWGQGIQRGYGLDHKRFSLFNVGRASYRAAIDGGALPDNVGLVPVLHQGAFDQDAIDRVLWHLARDGSAAATKAGVSGTAAEGVVVFHEAARQSFKVTLEGDESPKGQA